jgi:sugar (pentulose or hexulose) kinase
VSSLAVDVGGTFIKAAVITEGRVGKVVRAPIPEFLDPSGALGEHGHAREIDPASLDAAVNEALASLRSGVELDGRVFVSGQMAGLAFVDDTGAALAPLISWQDTRYVDVDRVAAAIGAEPVVDLGDGLRVGSPVVTLASQTRPAGSHVTSLIAYVAGRIAGVRARAVHATDAGSWGLLDTRRGRWSEPACRAAGVAPGSLPCVVAGIEPVSPGSGVHVAIADQQAALLGAGLEPGWVSVNLATGCQVSLLSDDFGTSAQTRPYFGAGFGGRYLHTVTHLPAGRLLAAELRATRGSEDWDWLARQGLDQLGAVDVVVRGIADAVNRLGAAGQPILFSGGVIQQLPALQERIVNLTGARGSRVFRGDDAALAGLVMLAAETHPRDR